jgi:hypothetical protein
MSDGQQSGSSGSGLSGPIPAGWYPDPAGGAGKRWWDGSRWTHNTQEPEEAPALPTFGNYVPVEQRSFTAAPVADAGVAYTRASWWLSFSPIWTVVPQVVVVESIMSVASPPAPLASFVPGLALLNIALWGVLLALAFADRIKLHSLGNDSAASPFWVLLTPLAYLIVRAQHVRLYAMGGWASVVWWCIAFVVTPGLALLGLFAAYGLFAT